MGFDGFGAVEQPLLLRLLRQRIHLHHIPPIPQHSILKHGQYFLPIINKHLPPPPAPSTYPLPPDPPSSSPYPQIPSPNTSHSISLSIIKQFS